MNRIARIALVAVLGAWLGGALTGCAGYRVGPLHKGDYQTIAVPMFRNRTYKPQLEAQVTNAIIKYMQTDGALRIVPVADADVVLTGEITRFYRLELRSTHVETREPREYKLCIEARIEARNQRTGAIVLKPTLVTGNAETFIGSDLQSTEYQSLPLIADDLARHAARLLTESW